MSRPTPTKQASRSGSGSRSHGAAARSRPPPWPYWRGVVRHRVESAARAADNSLVEGAKDTTTVTISKRIRAAQLSAFVALLAALVGGFGPAERIRTAYAWPPKTLPDVKPHSVWYTPLLLSAHRPDRISAAVPCTLPRSLPGATRPLNVLSTARHPSRTGSLSLTATADELVLAVGERVLDRIPRIEPTDASCVYRLQVTASGWSWEEPSHGLAETGSLDAMPVVFGLFSAVDLRGARAPAVEILSATHATRPTTVQAVSWALALAAIVTALMLVGLDGFRRSTALVPMARAVRSGAGLVDGLVGLVLVGWWVLSPAFFDDGWVAARERMYSESKGFSHYYTTFGVNLPIDYWVEWLQHWVVQSSDALLVHRVPSLACLAAIWIVCRWTLSRILPSTAGGPRSAEVLALGTTFLAGALAWGMTLRPEPFVAILVIGTFACMVAFVETRSAAPVAVAAALVPLGLTAHPEGVVVLAPVLAASPALLRWARPRLAVASAIAASCTAFVAVLAFIGSDVAQRRADAQAIVEFGHSVAWRYELIRYTSLADFPWGTPLRRASVVLIGLALLAWALWRRRARKSLLDLPAPALGIALALFVVTPSKHPWHFGALIGLTAVAVAAETARLRMRRSRLPGAVQPLVVLVVTSVIIVWTWDPRQSWNAIDLRSLDWTPSIEAWIDFSSLAAILPLALVAVLAVRELARGRRSELAYVPWRAVTWIAPALAAPLIAFTVVVLVADAVSTNSWTLARQNLGSLRGSHGCGIADDLVVALPSSARSASAVHSVEARPAWMPAPPVSGLALFPLVPSETGVTASPWIELPKEPFGLFVAGSPEPNELTVERGVLERGRTRALASAAFSAADALDIRSATLDWRLVATGELPFPPRSIANVFRIKRQSPAPPGTPLVVSGPVTYRSDELAPRLARSNGPTLILPDVLPYFPCARLPVLRDGAVEVPSHIVATREGDWLFQENQRSPFSGLRDLYRLERMPIADSRDAPTESLEVFAVDRRIAGAAQAPPAKSTVVS